jgi:hypothetical protein
MPGLSGGGGGSNAVRAGRAFVEMTLRDNLVYRALGNLKEKFRSFGGFMVKAGAIAGGVGASVLAAFKPALDALGEQAKIADAADAFGLTGEAASRLFGIMAAGGSDVRDATEGIVTFNQRIEEALAGTGEEAQKLFAGLGRGPEQFAGDSAEKFYQLLDALRQVPDPAKRVQLLLKAVGEDTGKNLIPLLSMSADEVRNLGDAFETSTGDLKAAREAARAQTMAMAGLKRIWGEVATAVAPVVKEFADAFATNLKPLVEFVRANREAVATVVKVAAGLVAAGAALVALGTVAGAVSTAIAALGAVGSGAVALVLFPIKALVAAVASLLSPIGLVVAAVGGLAYLWVTQTESGAKAFDAVKAAAGSFAEYLRGAFQAVAAVGVEAWGGIVAAVQKGDLALAGEIALTALELIWAKAVAEMARVWDEFGTGAMDAWHELTDGMGELLSEVWNVVKEVFTGIWETVVGVVNRIKEVWAGLSDSVKSAVTALAVAFAPIVGPIMLTIAAVEKAWNGMTGSMLENLNNFAAWVEKIYVDVKASIVNTFNSIARAVLDTAITTAKGLEAITPGDKWKKIREELEAARGGLTDVDSRAEKERIDRERDALNDKIKAEREAAKKLRDVARAEDAKAAEDRAAELEKRLKELTAKAKEAKAPALDYGGGGDFGALDPAAAAAAVLAGSKGSFTAAMASQRFGGQTVGQKQLGKLNDINNGVRDLNKNVKDVGKKLEFK